MTHVPVMLSVAGSDPSGGAGIQADLKTATALSVYGAAVITSLTAQNTTGVSGIHGVPADFVADQYDAVVSDLDVQALKIGMLGTSEVAVALAEAVRRRPVRHVVLDPVMVATSGDRLVDEDTVDAVRAHLLPLATLLTPNLPEAGTLLGRPPPDEPAQMAAAGHALRELGADSVLVKGGHLIADAGDAEPTSTVIDVLVDDAGPRTLASRRIATANTHGTGCTLSAAIASALVGGERTLRQAVDAAKSYLGGALQGGADLQIGHGAGPVDHLWERR